MAAVHYPSVPEHWKAPMGPYYQAPPEYGGEWWYANPFTGPEPWLTQGQLDPNKPIQTCDKPGFAEIFGPWPTSQNTDLTGTALQTARNQYTQDCEYFKQAGIPPGYEQATINEANRAYALWAMGKMAIFEGRYGWGAKWPGSDDPLFEEWATTAIDHPDLTVAQYQINLIQQGIIPAPIHPMVPPSIIPHEHQGKQGNPT